MTAAIVNSLTNKPHGDIMIKTFSLTRISWEETISATTAAVLRKGQMPTGHVNRIAAGGNSRTCNLACEKVSGIGKYRR
jgi:hypothetical protein